MADCHNSGAEKGSLSPSLLPSGGEAGGFEQLAQRALEPYRVATGRQTAPHRDHRADRAQPQLHRAHGRLSESNSSAKDNQQPPQRSQQGTIFCCY